MQWWEAQSLSSGEKHLLFSDTLFFFSRTNNAMGYHYQYQRMPQTLMILLDDLCFKSLQKYEMEGNGQLSFFVFQGFL